MSPRSLREPLKQFKRNLESKLVNIKFVVFGSQANGTATKDSDIDVVVVSSSFEGQDEDDRLDLLYKASIDIDPDIQPWGVTPREFAQFDVQTTLGDAREHGLVIKVD